MPFLVRSLSYEFAVFKGFPLKTDPTHAASGPLRPVGFRHLGRRGDAARGDPRGYCEATESLNVSVYAGVELEAPERGSGRRAELLETLLSFLERFSARARYWSCLL